MDALEDSTRQTRYVQRDIMARLLNQRTSTNKKRHSVCVVELDIAVNYIKLLYVALGSLKAN